MNSKPPKDDDAFAYIEAMKLKVMEAEETAQDLNEEADKVAIERELEIASLAATHIEVRRENDNDDDDLPPASSPAPLLKQKPQALSPPSCIAVGQISISAQ